jgi:hypothetical protein
VVVPSREPAVVRFWKGIKIAGERQWTSIQTPDTSTTTTETKKKMTTTTATNTSHSHTQWAEDEAAYYYGTLNGLMLNMDLQPLPPHPALVSADEVKEAEEEMTTALLFDGTLGDMVAVSTPRTACAGLDAAGEGVWRTLTRADYHDQHHDFCQLPTLCGIH